MRACHTRTFRGLGSVDPSAYQSYTFPNTNLQNYYPLPTYVIIRSFGPFGRGTGAVAFHPAGQCKGSGFSTFDLTASSTGPLAAGYTRTGQAVPFDFDCWTPNLLPEPSVLRV